MEREQIQRAEALLMQDGYRDEANLLRELAVELRDVTRAFEELYKERYGDTPKPIFGHV